MKLGADRGVAVGPNDCWDKVCSAIGRNYQPEVHETPDENLEIFEDIADIARSDFALCRGSTLICSEARFNVGSLLLTQPFRLFREVRDDEVKD